MYLGYETGYNLQQIGEKICQWKIKLSDVCSWSSALNVCLYIQLWLQELL